MIDISDGVTLFNESDFFSAHDFFEDIWMDAAKNEKDFFQGMVQISVGCYHLICGNMKGAKSQLSKGNNKLKKFEPDFYKVNIGLLTKKVDELLFKMDFSKNITQEIPTIEFIN